MKQCKSHEWREIMLGFVKFCLYCKMRWFLPPNLKEAEIYDMIWRIHVDRMKVGRKYGMKKKFCTIKTVVIVGIEI